LARRRQADGAAVAEASTVLWALRDVSFDVKPGEVVGIIGRNGAGKSTLLKILSRITEPTEGRAIVRGRMASLLEVGTGFHPELSGRENIYLNGAILGMGRREIDRKFDDIVAFSEIERFLETPVKRYSSGMYVRLAFAVAAHLEPEILIVDEVLAVGDAAFQKKCLNKMQDVGQHGRTVLFVSHNMPAVTRLCPRAVLINEGSVLEDGPSAEVVSHYLRAGLNTAGCREWLDATTAPGSEIVRMRAARVRTDDGDTADAVDIRKSVGVEIEFDVLEAGHVVVPKFHFYNDEGVFVFVLGDGAWQRRPREKGRYVSTAWIPGNLLAEGTLGVNAVLITPSPHKVHCFQREAIAFQVIDTQEGDSARGDYTGYYPGVIRPIFPWTTQFIPDGTEAPVGLTIEVRR
jgi:lipopolysaccharide transport system ATP-binding protein